MNRIKRALISVSNKEKILDLAKNLSRHGVEIISTGGSAKLLKDNKIDVIEISEYTNFPEMLDGRVKTLHPKVHGGILANRNLETHLKTLKQNNIKEIDLVVVNLYPFQQTIQKQDCSLEEAIENIDIGGPTMIRAAAKNYQSVSVLTDPLDYNKFIEEIDNNQGSIDLETRFLLAKKAFLHTAQYDAAISNYLNKSEDTLPKNLMQVLEKNMDMRYGENPHQEAAFYKDSDFMPGSLSNFIQLQGKDLSFNNLNDSDNAWECVKSFKEPSCVIVKHANPCGACSASNVSDAYTGAYLTDPTSAFGGIIAFNIELDAKVTSLIVKQFAEVIIAPNFSSEALEIFKTKPNIRLLKVPLEHSDGQLDYKKIGGGWLVQTADNHVIDIEKCEVVTKLKPNQKDLLDLKFAWQVAQYVKSNAIVFCRNKKTLGIGAGQMSRVDSTRIAAIKAENSGLNLQNSVVASDAFFPFRDGIDVLASYGAKYVIQPGGSIKDNEVIQAADELGLVMLFTKIRHFKH